MIKRIFKRIFVFAVIACLLLACVPSLAFADVIDFQEAAKAGATIVDLYGMVNNTSLAYDVSSSGPALTIIENLYTEYSSSAGDPYTLAAIGAAAAAAGAFAVVYDAVTGQGYIQLYQEQYLSSLDGFWDYTLSDLGLQRNNDDLFEYNLDANDKPVTLVLYSSNRVASLAVPFGDPGWSWTNTFNSAAPCYRTNYEGFYNEFRISAYTPNNVLAYGILYYDNGDVYLGAITSDSDNRFYTTNKYSNESSASGNTSRNWTLDNATGLDYYQNINFISASNLSSNVFFWPIYPSWQAALDDVSAYIGDPTSADEEINIGPSNYIGDPLTAPAVITIPDPSNPLYNPGPVVIPTNIPFNPSWGDPLPDGVSTPEPGVAYPITDPSILNNMIPSVWDSIVSNDVSVDPDPDPDPEPGPAPSEVFTPLLPVTLPSFNFSFSGIWHYVREWVSSLAAWFTTLFLIWSKLPYAMVVPVYATAVVVIVLGVYKRFFM